MVAAGIVVRDDLPPNARVRILVHKLAHALGVTYDSHSRAEAAVMVDTVTFVVCPCAALDTGGESILYVAGGARRARSAPSARSRKRSTRSAGAWAIRDSLWGDSAFYAASGGEPLAGNASGTERAALPSLAASTANQAGRAAYSPLHLGLRFSANAR